MFKIKADLTGFPDNSQYIRLTLNFSVNFIQKTNRFCMFT
jgi:hypothetical protein